MKVGLVVVSLAALSLFSIVATAQERLNLSRKDPEGSEARLRALAERGAYRVSLTLLDDEDKVVRQSLELVAFEQFPMEPRKLRLAGMSGYTIVYKLSKAKGNLVYEFKEEVLIMELSIERVIDAKEGLYLDLDELIPKGRTTETSQKIKVTEPIVLGQKSNMEINKLIGKAQKLVVMVDIYKYAPDDLRHFGIK
jgi:hypothetical protein